MAVVEVARHFKPFVECGVYVQLGLVAFILCAFDHTFVFQIAAADVILRIGVTFGNDQFVVLHRSRAENLVHPVYAGLRSVEIGLQFGLVRHFVGVEQRLGILFRSHHLGHVIGVGKAHAGVEGDGLLSLFALLGLYEYHAVGAAATVDGRGRGVFQHLNALDIFGIDTVKSTLAHDTIHNIERIVVAMDGACSAYTDLDASTRHATLYHVDTCHAALKSLADIFDGLILEGLVAHDRYGTGQVGLTHAAIANHDDLVQHIVVFRHCYLEGMTVAYSQFLAGKTDIGDLERVVA